MLWKNTFFKAVPPNKQTKKKPSNHPQPENKILQEVCLMYFSEYFLLSDEKYLIRFHRGPTQVRSHMLNANQHSITDIKRECLLYSFFICYARYMLWYKLQRARCIYMGFSSCIDTKKLFTDVLFYGVSTISVTPKTCIELCWLWWGSGMGRGPHLSGAYACT